MALRGFSFRAFRPFSAVPLPPPLRRAATFWLFLSTDFLFGRCDVLRFFGELGGETFLEGQQAERKTEHPGEDCGGLPAGFHAAVSVGSERFASGLLRGKARKF